MRAEDLGVQVVEAARRRVREREHLVRVEDGAVQVVVERAVLVVVADQEELRPRTRPFDVGRYETCTHIKHSLIYPAANSNA